jgi:hypothetical protein
MSVRAFLVGLAASLLVAASALAAEEAGNPAVPANHGASRIAAARGGQDEPAPARWRWGIPEWPFPVMEAERKLVGFHFEFEFGGGSPARRSRVR